MRKKKNPSSQTAITDSSLRNQLSDSKKEIDTLLSHLNNQTDPDLIDCYSYQLKGAYMRYKFLLKQIRTLTEAPHNNMEESA